MRHAKGYTATLRKQQAELRLSLRKAMATFGGEPDEDNEWQVVFTLNTMQAGALTFTMHKRDEKEASDLFSIYIRPALDRTSEDVRAMSAKISEVFHDKPNPFTGKWNIHELHPARALDELTLRLEWLMEPITHNTSSK